MSNKNHLVCNVCGCTIEPLNGDGFMINENEELACEECIKFEHYHEKMIKENYQKWYSYLSANNRKLIKEMFI